MTAYAFEVTDCYGLLQDFEEGLEFWQGYVLPERNKTTQWDREIAPFVKLYDEIHDDEGYIEQEDVEFAFVQFDGKNTKIDFSQFQNLENMFNSRGKYSREQFVRACLEYATGIVYSAFPIHGSFQGDYATLLLPVDTPKEAVRRLEALYFGEGTGLIIEESDEPRNTPDEIEDGFFYFSEEYEPDKLKEVVTELTGCQEVVLWTIKGERRVPIYEKH